MANAARVSSAIFLVLQVACAVARDHAHDPRASRIIYQASVVMKVYGFDQGDQEDQRGGPPSCGGHYRDDRESLIALPPNLYRDGGECGILFRITSTQTGLSAMAEVLDECLDCSDGEVGTSARVWRDLGYDPNDGGVAPVTIYW